MQNQNKLLLSNVPVKVDRNENCWCGSGRKLKKCHFYQYPPSSVIIINGHPNSGKTTAKKTICRKLFMPYFHEFCFDSSMRKESDKREKNRKGYWEAIEATFEAIAGYTERKSVITDLLVNAKTAGRLKQKLEEAGVEVLTVRLFCDRDERVRRDRKRKEINPKAPYGFNNGLNPEPDPALYALEIDTTQKDEAAVAEEILGLARKTIWAQ